jgi:hypothetical protein
MIRRGSTISTQYCRTVSARVPCAASTQSHSLAQSLSLWESREGNERRGSTCIPRRARGRDHHHRGGYVLVLFALLLFGIFAMAALVIDLGFARLAQRQMQTAADAAALEGLRGTGDTSMDFAARQEAAEKLIAWTFEDDLDVSNGDDGIAGDGGQFGAGPLVNFSGSAGDPAIFASQLMTVDLDNTTYKPATQKGNESASEFRVNLQRGGALNDSADLYAYGPAVPYLFARGSLINRQLIANGITVRAESTAVPLPAVKIGMPVSNFPGAIAIGYSLADWNTGAVSPLQLNELGLELGQPVNPVGSALTLIDGYCCIFANISGADYVVGFGWIKDGSPITGAINVAPGNAVCRLSEVWQSIDAGIRNDVLAQAATVVHGLHVPAPQARR